MTQDLINLMNDCICILQEAVKFCHALYDEFKMNFNALLIQAPR